MCMETPIRTAIKETASHYLEMCRSSLNMESYSDEQKVMYGSMWLRKARKLRDSVDIFFPQVLRLAEKDIIEHEVTIVILEMEYEFHRLGFKESEN